MSTDTTFVVIGASMAGANAAATLREEGFDGRLVLLGAEQQRPYERPPLSKDYLQGESPREKIYVHPESFYDEQGIELRLGSRATALDTAAAEVEIDGGERIAYNRALIATGCEPRRLSIPGSELDGIHYLRTVGDSDTLRAALEHGGSLVVVGSGWIGSEVAASARTRGVDVTVIDPLAVPLERVLGEEVGAVYRDIHVDHGVHMLMGTGVEAFEGDGRVERVRTSDGQSVDCDAVVAGIGAAPRTELASAAGLPVESGVLCDEHLQTGVAGVFAAGDVAEAMHPFYGRRVRVEHWANALNQGQAVAHNMLGRDTPYEQIPYFFSDQYEVGMEYTGLASASDQVVFRGDPAGGEFIAFWLRDGRVTAGMNVNVWDVTDAIQALIRRSASVDAAALADPGTSLEDLAVEEPAA